MSQLAISDSNNRESCVCLLAFAIAAARVHTCGVVCVDTFARHFGSLYHRSWTTTKPGCSHFHQSAKTLCGQKLTIPSCNFECHTYMPRCDRLRARSAQDTLRSRHAISCHDALNPRSTNESNHEARILSRAVKCLRPGGGCGSLPEQYAFDSMAGRISFRIFGASALCRRG